MAKRLTILLSELLTLEDRELRAFHLPANVGIVGENKGLCHIETASNDIFHIFSAKSFTFLLIYQGWT